jgi:hypothetical protein
VRKLVGGGAVTILIVFAIVQGTALAGSGAKSCRMVRVIAGHGLLVTEGRSITARGVSCAVARKVAVRVFRYVDSRFNTPAGVHDRCLRHRICSALGFACHAHFGHAMNEKCTRGAAVVRWREFDFDNA